MTGKLLWFVYLPETETGVVGVVQEKKHQTSEEQIRAVARFIQLCAFSCYNRPHKYDFG